jgi:preprotein translocase subunit SecG
MILIFVFLVIAFILAATLTGERKNNKHKGRSPYK